MSGHLTHLVRSFTANLKKKDAEIFTLRITVFNCNGRGTFKVLLLRKLCKIEGRLPRKPMSKSLLDM